MYLAFSDETWGVMVIAALLIATAMWWVAMKRRQSWWWGYSRRPGDITGERWLNTSEARADKPMPERRIVIDRRRRR